MLYKLLYIIFIIPISKSADYDITKIKQFNCTDSLKHCSGKGICSSTKDNCECFKGYQTYFTDFDSYINNTPRCNYKSKNQMYALIFSIFLSFGSVHFYLGHSIIGTFQFILFLFNLIFGSVIISKLSIKHLKKVSRAEAKKSFTYIILMFLFSFIFLFWYVFDIVMVFYNIYRDGNNASMELIFNE
jgi:hypothetical protein